MPHPSPRRRATAATMLLAACLALVPPASGQDTADGRYRDFGDIGGFLNVVPPGQDGVLNGVELLLAQGGVLPPHFADQVPLYEDLVYEAGLPVAGDSGEPLLGVTDGDLARFYKDASFGVDAAGDPAALEPAYQPGGRADVVVVRDTAFGVPHIVGDTREGAMFAAGYVTAEDRLFLMDALRHVGRARLSEFLGASEANKAMDREQLLVAPYLEEELSEQLEEICALEPEGPRGCADLDAYAAGVNAYIDQALTDPSLLPGEYLALQQMPTPWIPEDTVAIASLVGGIFGRGGGGEVGQGLFLSGLIEQHGEQQGRAIFEDLRGANDPEAPHTTDVPFPYNNHDPAQLDPDSVALLDPGSFVGAFADEPAAFLDDGRPAAQGPASRPRLGVIDGPLGPIDLRTSFGMSNAILASGDVTDGGVPIAVFGPQTGYFTPQLLVEMDIHGPGIDARGVAFAGTNVYVQLGRGNGYAWSATSASGDNSDEWVLELCEPLGVGEPTLESRGYLHDGECQELDVVVHQQLAKPSAGGIPDPGAEAVVFTLEIERVPAYDFAPVVGRGTVDGRPVAIMEQRSTYGAELRSAVGFQRINDPEYMASGVDAFLTAFDGVDYTFNWFYVDDEVIAYKHSCLCPIRDPRTDPDLPTWGTGEWDWTGDFIAPAEQPQAVDPPFLANWNNKQAPEFRAADNNVYVSTYRSEFLASRMRTAIASGVPLTRGAMVSIMEDAGTVDLQGQEIYPRALEIMGASAPAGVGDAAQLGALRAQLAAWVAGGGHRRDVDRDGTYDHAVAVAIGDVWMHTMLDGVFGDEVGEAPWPERIEDHPRQGVGSAFNGGRGNVLHKDLRQVLGEDVEGRRSRTYCGNGTVAGCAGVLWQALAAAAAVLATAPPSEPSCAYPEAYHFGSADPAAWVYPSVCDEIIQSAVGVVAAAPMQWVNRPTFQQVAQPGSAIGRLDGATRIETGIAVSRQAFGDGAETVVLAAAGTFADAVAGAPLAATLEAPLLLVAPDTVGPAVARELARLGATSAVVLGGAAAIGESVVAQVQELGLRVRRVSGADRFATAAAIAAELAPDGVVQAVVASGATFPDALAAGPYAVATDRPVLLTNPDALPQATRDALAGAGDVVIAGGTAAVTDAVAASVSGGGATVTRIAGPDRYATGRAFADAAIAAGVGVRDVYAVTGAAFPDALTAGAAAAHTIGILVLLDPGSLVAAPGARDLLDQVGADTEDFRRLWLVGGQAALPSALRAELEELI